MRLRVIIIVSIALLGGIFLFNGCTCNMATQQSQQSGDLIIGIIVTQPLTYYYGTTAYLEVWGPDGIYLTKEIPMYMGNQVAIFRNLPAGRYIASLSYSGMVATKCAVLCGMGDVQWRADCTQELKEFLNQKKNPPKGKTGWQGWDKTSEYPDFAPEKCPGCGHGEPCQTTIIFKMPGDALKYDP